MLTNTSKLKVILLMFTGILTAGAYAQEVDVVKASELYDILKKCDDRYDLCVYNFWATWCAPCIRELPQFETLARNHQEIDVTLVSLDDKEDINLKVKPFIVKREIKSHVLLLDETDFNEIIPRINDEWSGAIPATLIVDRRSGKKYFYEQEFKESELEKTINEILTINY